MQARNWISLFNKLFGFCCCQLLPEQIDVWKDLLQKSNKLSLGYIMSSEI